MIEIRELSKRYDHSQTEHSALHNLNLTIQDGDIFGIIGMSGAGKSTLVRCLNALERPSSGTVLIDGEDISCLQGKKLRSVRANIAMIFQNFNLFSQKTVLQNVLYPLVLAKRGSYHSLEQRGLQLLDKVGLKDKAYAYPSQLSGGQKQRVAIARALAHEPRYILCDEATSALDSLTTNQILKLLRSINEEFGTTLILITHSMDVAQKVCNKIAVLDQGRLVEFGETQQIFGQPQHEITARLIGKVSWDAE